MSSGTSSGDESSSQAGSAPDSGRPEWADGLRQLYDSVVDEPLPDAFKDLLDRLDDTSSDEDGYKADGSERSPS